MRALSSTAQWAQKPSLPKQFELPFFFSSRRRQTRYWRDWSSDVCSSDLIETPRAATMITDTNIQRYGIQTIDQLTTVAPGTFTASFYGVPGTLNVRGTLAENYFEGFKLITNWGTYATP